MTPPLDPVRGPFILACAGLLVMTSASLAACGGSDKESALEAGAACVPTLQNESCMFQKDASDQRMRCDPATSAWESIETCGPKQKCQTQPDPNASTDGIKISVCVDSDSVDSAAVGVDAADTPDSSLPPLDAGPGQTAVTYLIEGAEATEQTFGGAGPDTEIVTVSIKNSGTTTVIIDATTWSTDGPHLVMEWAKSAPVGNFHLGAGGKLSFYVSYVPDFVVPGAGSASLTVSYADDVLPDQKLTFYPPTAAGKPGKACANSTDIQLHNPTPTFGNKRCVRVLNCGEGPLQYKGATLSQTGNAFKITTQPKAGQSLPPLGSPGNLADNPASFAVCYQVAIIGAQQALASIAVKTDDPDKAEMVFKLAVVRRTAPDLRFTCKKGIHRLAFGAVAEQQWCMVVNNTSNQIEVKSGQLFGGPLPEDEFVGQIYQTKYTKLATSTAEEGTPVQLPVKLGEHEALRVDVTYGGGDALDVPPATLRLVHQVEDATLVTSAGLWPPKCSARRLAVGPTVVPMAMRSKPSQPSGFIVSMINLGCGDLHIKPGCMANTSTGTVCSTPVLSDVFTLPGAVVDMDVSSDQISQLSVSMPATKALDPWQEHWLSLTWCTNVWSNGSCEKATHKDAFKVQGWVDDGLLAPAPQLATSYKGNAGRPVMLTVSGTQQAWAMAPEKRWIWNLVQRPAGSAYWLHRQDQATETPVLMFTPDLPGSYAFQVRGRYAHPTDAGQIVWGKQAQVWVSVIL